MSAEATPEEIWRCWTVKPALYRSRSTSAPSGRQERSADAGLPRADGNGGAAGYHRRRCALSPLRPCSAAMIPPVLTCTGLRRVGQRPLGWRNGGRWTTCCRRRHSRTVRGLERLPPPLIQPPDLRWNQAYAAGYPVCTRAIGVRGIRGAGAVRSRPGDHDPAWRRTIQKITLFAAKLALASARAGIDVLCFYDDVGMQTGMQISPQLWRRFIKPAWQRVARPSSGIAQGEFFLHNSCGGSPVVGDLVELRVPHPHLIPSQVMVAIPFGSPEEVRREVRRLAEIVGPSRRAILMPSNVIQPETPWENVVAFAEEARAIRSSR